MSYSQWSASLKVPHLPAPTSALVHPSSSTTSDALSLHYQCSCGRLQPHLAYLFWCKLCQAIQCQQCTQQQVDTYFCPACLNSVFTTPAFANQNRCEQCVECPACSHILSPTQRPSGLFAFVCEYCRWCSEDYVQHIPGGGSKPTPSRLTALESNLLSSRIKEAEQNVGAQATFQGLLNYYRMKTVKGGASGVTGLKRGAAAAPGNQLFDEFENVLSAADASNPLLDTPLFSRVQSLSITSSSSPATAASPSNTATSAFESSNVGRWMAWRAERENKLQQQHYVLSSEAKSNKFDPIPHELLGYFQDEASGEAAANNAKGIEDLSTLSQRLSHPNGQHFLLNELVPRRKALSTKLAHRCKTCTKFIVKPGPGASKPNMEVHMAAVTHLPTITIGQFRPMKVSRPTSIIVYFKNPVETAMNLWLTLPTDEEEIAKATTASGTSSAQSLYPRPATPKSTASVEFIRAKVIVNAYDEIPEENAVWQDEADKQKPEAEPGLVVFRHLSKVGLLLHVTPTTHLESTHFVLLVNLQSEQDPATSDVSASPAAPSPSPTPAGIITFPLHVNLGFAQM